MTTQPTEPSLPGRGLVGQSKAGACSWLPVPGLWRVSPARRSQHEQESAHQLGPCSGLRPSVLSLADHLASYFSRLAIMIVLRASGERFVFSRRDHKPMLEVKTRSSTEWSAPR